MNKISRKPAQTVAELASARQHQENPADHHGARGGGELVPCSSSTFLPSTSMRRDMHEIFKRWTWDFGLDLGKRAGLGWKLEKPQRKHTDLGKKRLDLA